MAVRFGAGFLGHISADNGPERLRALAEVCEDGGLDSLWVADQRWMRDVFVSLADVAARTSRILLGTRVTDPYIRHPALTAVATATLDEASGGRAILGLGAGGSGFAQLGIKRERPAVAVREAIELIRRLWTGDGRAYEGQLIKWRPGQIEFTCRPDIPIVIAARGPLLLELAGELTDGAIVASGTTPGGVAWARQHIERGEHKAGRPIGSTELMHMTYVSISDDRGAARQAAKRGILGAVVGSHPHYEFLGANGLKVPPELYAYLDAGGRDSTEILARIPDEFVARLAIAGNVAECGDQLGNLIDAGIQHPLLSPIPAADESPVEIIRVIASEILPSLRSRHA